MFNFKKNSFTSVLLAGAFILLFGACGFSKNYSNPVIIVNIEDDLHPGAKVFMESVPDPEAFILECANDVVGKLFSREHLIKGDFQDVDTITISVKNMKAPAAKGGNFEHIKIGFSQNHIAEKYKKDGKSDEEILFELKGVLYHELTHGYQYSPKNAGGYRKGTDFFSMIEGVADFVRIDLGQHKRPRKAGGHWTDGYTTTGYFLEYLSEKYGDDFIFRFNQSAQELGKWTWDEGLTWAIGETVSVAELWKEYQLQIPVKPMDYADPFIGTGSHGHTYPGATLPFGMVQLSPDTRNDGSWDGCGGYHYSDKEILGFSHTHLSGVGVTDYGDILLQPITGEVSLEPWSNEVTKGYASTFRHETEKAYPGYYSVRLDDHKVKAEMTTTERVGFHRYTADKAGEMSVLLDLIHRDPVLQASIEFVDERTIKGMRHSANWARDMRVYFVMEFSKPIKEFLIFDDKKLTDKALAKGKALQVVAKFDVDAKEAIEVKVAISNVSTEGALKNLQAEAADLTFDTALKQATDVWTKELGKVMIEGGTIAQRRNFYSALYHCLVVPNVYQDVDGQYRGMDGVIRQAEDFTNYTVFSLWDTFRGLHPLLTILEPERTNDFIKSLTHKSQQYGELPMWELASNDTRCMIGYHAVSVIADAWEKGIRDYNLEEVYAEMKKTAMLDKRGLKAYRILGYVPSNKSSQGVSKTLEYAYNDWCVAQVAKALNKQEDYEYFVRRASNYKHIYDESVSFMRGKTDTHDWVSDFDATKPGYNYTEGNSFQYSLFVPHDLKGLSELLGGKEALAEWLDKLFETEMGHHLGDDSDITGLIGQYAHGNEPSHHMAYLYNYAGKPWKTQEIVRHITNDLYADTPAGICGNEDCGQMSAWYVLSAMGFYSVCPGGDYYEIGSPIFDKVTLNLDNGKQFIISAQNIEEKYVQSLKLNGKNYNKPLVYHKDILDGGQLAFKMGSTPNKKALTDYPEKHSDVTAARMPYLSNPSNFFLKQYEVEMKSDDKGAKFYYTLDGSEPSTSSQQYKRSFKVDSNTTLKMVSLLEDGSKSNVSARELTISQSLETESNKLEKGLQYDYYEGVYRSAYDFELEEPLTQGIASRPDLSMIQRVEWIALDFVGVIDVPVSGEYQFWVSANDGCQLIIDGEEQFESDGRKSKPFEQQTTIALSKGLHHFRLNYYQCSDGIELKADWKGPGFNRQAVPANVFYHLKK